MYVLVCAGASVYVYALRIASSDTVLLDRNTFIYFLLLLLLCYSGLVVAGLQHTAVSLVFSKRGAC